MINLSSYDRFERCYLIAEIGVNHNGSIDLAKQMILAAKEAGADAVKFQTFSADKLVTRATPKVEYQKNTTSPSESHFEMIKKLELDEGEHFILKKFCDNSGIEFLSTPYDVESVDLLEKVGVSQYKTASADIVDLLLHERIAKTGKPVIISVGMATLGEIEETLNIYKEYNHNDIVLLHCVSNYPCSLGSLNLRVLTTLFRAFHFPVGYSDHSVGSTAAIVSIALGAVVIEKHFTIDKSLPGPDHKASSSTEEFADLVRHVRNAELVLGERIKSCQEEEKMMQQVSRKSVTLARSMSKGETIKKSDLVMMRPGLCLKARDISKIIGMKINKNTEKHYQPDWTDFDKE